MIDKGQHRYVVELVGFLYESVNIALYILDELPGSGIRLTVERSEQPLGSKELQLRIGGLGNTIGVDKEAVAGIHVKGMLCEYKIFRYGKGR